MSDDKMREQFDAWFEKQFWADCFPDQKKNFYAVWKAALSQSEPVQVSQEQRIKNAILYGTSHPEMYKDSYHIKLEAENEALRQRVAELVCSHDQMSALNIKYCDGYESMKEERDILQSRVAELEIKLAQETSGYIEALNQCAINADRTFRLQSECDRLKATRQFECWSNDDGDSWCENPANEEFVDGLKVGDVFELLAGFESNRVNYIVTKAPDDVDDDYEVELIK